LPFLVIPNCLAHRNIETITFIMKSNDNLS
jgi:hypothetical protein